MPVQSVDRAVSILNALSAAEGYLGVTQLSNQLDLHKSTVHRLLVSLKQAGLVERDPRSRKYRLGVRLVELGYAVLNSRGLPQVALPYLRYLTDALEEITYLGMQHGDRVLNLLQVPAPHLVQSVSWLEGGSLHSTSAGKVLLAHVPEEELESYLEKDLVPRTENTITDVAELRAELERVREEGYATNWEESREGINAVAVPIQKPDGSVIAAIGVVGPTYRFTREKALKAPPMMIGVAREIAEKLAPRSFDIF